MGSPCSSLEGTINLCFCTITKSALKLQCGIRLYNKIIDITLSEVNIHITAVECLTFARELIYRTPDCRQVSIEKGKENVITFILGGSMHATDSKYNWCSGSDLRIQTEIVSEAIILEQVKMWIIVAEGWYLLKNHPRLTLQLETAFFHNQYFSSIQQL